MSMLVVLYVLMKYGAAAFVAMCVYEFIRGARG